MGMGLGLGLGLYWPSLPPLYHPGAYRAEAGSVYSAKANFLWPPVAWSMGRWRRTTGPAWRGGGSTGGRVVGW